MNSEPTRLYATLIDRLSDVPGVVAAAAFDESGRCLSCFVGESLHSLGTARVIPLLQELAAPSNPKSPFEEGVTFVERQLVRVLLRRAVTSTFIALVDPEADVEVVVAHLGRSVEQIARASRPPPPSVDATSRRDGSGFFIRNDGVPQSAAATESRITSEAVVERLRLLAIETLGVDAQSAFERAKSGVDNIARQVPRARWVEFVGRLASEIEDDSERDTFVTRALSIPSTRVRESDAMELLSPLARWVVERRSTG